MVTIGFEENANDLAQRVLTRIVRSDVYSIGTCVRFFRIGLVAKYIRRDCRTAVLRINVPVFPDR